MRRAWTAPPGSLGLGGCGGADCRHRTGALVGRAPFYVLVIATTMPGAFFWRNHGFEEHARETALAHMPQVGVLPNVH